MPYGRLRENITGAKRADVIIVTKTPAEISQAEKEKIRKEISPLQRQGLFFTTLEYGDLQPVFGNNSTSLAGKITCETAILLVTGIANPVPFVNYLKGISSNITHISYRDHHKFSETDIKNILSVWESIEQQDKIIITTEKDSVRLKDFSNFANPLKKGFFYIPVRIKFIDNEKSFIKIVTDYAGKNS